MNNIVITKDGDFKDENISSIPLGINNIILENNDFDLKKDNINNIKPMLSSSNTNSINLNEGKKVKIKPFFNKKVPSNTFAMMANKRNINNNSDEDSHLSDNSYETESDEILSNNTLTNSVKKDNVSEYDEEDDYSSIEEETNKKNVKSHYKSNSDDESEQESEYEDDESEESEPVKEKTYEEIQQEKQNILFNLERLHKQGYPPSKKYTMASSFEDMKFEYDRLKRQRDVEKSIKFSRKILMGCVSGIEFLNKKFDPFDVKLSGWSENMMENVNDYDEVFEELHDKYSESVKMAPELKLIAMVAGSGFMFHLSQSLFKSAGPKVSDILKDNPDIMKQVTEAAARKMGNTINKEFGEDDIVGNMMKQGINMKMNQDQRVQGPLNKPIQQKMNGPVGIDELLNELNSDNISETSSVNSINIKTSTKRTKGNKKGNVQLDLF
jgi:hypothetical protein